MDVGTDRRSNFRLFWLAQAISRFGDPITIVALAAITYELTGSAFYTSLAILVATLPAATFGFFAGAIADALGHRRSMVLADLARAFLIAAVPLTLAAGLSLFVAYALVFAAGMCAAVFNPARVSIIPTLTGQASPTSSNSLIFGTDRVVEIAGALAGGLLVAVIGEMAFYADAFTFLASALLLSVLRLTERRQHLSLSRTWADATAGLDHLRRSAVLAPNTAFSLLAQISLPVFNGLLPVFIFRRFAPGEPQLGATLFGAAEAALAVGAVIGVLALPRLARRIRKGRLVVAGFIGLGAAEIVASVTPTFELLVAAVVLVGVTNVLFFVPNISILQEHSPPALRGSVIGARISLLSLTWIPIALISGALADVVLVSILIGVAGAFTLLVALAATQIPAVSDVP